MTHSLRTATCALITALTALPAMAQDQQTASALMIDTTGAEIGSAKMVQGPAGILVHLKVTGLEPGAHGVHIHSVGVCDTGETFTTSEGHVGSGGAHGLLNPDGPEAGDLPNIYVSADGIGDMEAYVTMASLGGEMNDLLDADGSAFIVHANPD
ncbi:superoxide dismutase family protein, partial [Jannaschia donghaensis]|uniref:superoxide dismutase family protein n=1 Tax=Jannaschia donghaensis TaxID=420998 RepID=UPI0006D77DAD